LGTVISPGKNCRKGSALCHPQSGLIEDPFRGGADGLFELLGAEDRHAAAEPEEPADEFRRGSDGEGHPEAATFVRCHRLAGVPGAVLDSGGRGLVEEELHSDGLPPHHAEGVAHVGVQIEVKRELEGVGREGAALDPLHGEEPDGVAEMAVRHEVEGPIGVPQPVRVHLPPGRRIPGRGEVPELDRPSLGDGLRELVDGLLVLPVADCVAVCRAVRGRV
jgi:hypothetical protein